MRGYKTITIEWSYPIAYEDILLKDSMNDIGLYYISRVFGDNESILYIGETTYSYQSRLLSHKKNWLDSYRGSKYVRLGRIIEPENLPHSEYCELIEDAEKTIIFYMTHESNYDLLANVISTKSIAPNRDLLIKNIGYRGMLPKELYIPARYNVE